MVTTVEQFRALARLVGHDEWVDDPAMSDGHGWLAQLDATIRPAIERWAEGRDRTGACAAMAAVHLAAGPVRTPTEVIEDPFTIERDMVPTVAGATYEGSPVRTTGNPVKLGPEAAAPDRRPPWLGEHTADVLTDELGLGDGELRELERAGAIATLPR